MLDISFRAELPDKALVYLDGQDGRVFKQLLYKLGSEERVQNAIILSGLLAQISDGNSKISKASVRKIKTSFRELVGMSFEDFSKMLETI